MSVLRTIETKLEGLFEGVFGRAFRTHVQPVELARKLAKEMDDHRAVSVSRVYAPNEYTIYLSPDDRDQFSTYEDSLIGELQDYLGEHARRESYALLTRPRVLFEVDEDLAVGEFGIATRMVQAERGEEEEAELEPGATMAYRATGGATEPATPAELGLGREVVFLTVNGARRALEKQRVVIGRSKECDIQIGDPNISRRHAELRQEGSTYWLVDLDSTNGVEVNGRRQKQTKLGDGDRILLGSTELVFHRGVE